LATNPVITISLPVNLVSFILSAGRGVRRQRNEIRAQEKLRICFRDGFADHADQIGQILDLHDLNDFNALRPMPQIPCSLPFLKSSIANLGNTGHINFKKSAISGHFRTKSDKSGHTVVIRKYLLTGKSKSIANYGSIKNARRITPC